MYLERDGLLAACDVNAVGLSIGHVPVVHVDVVRLSGAAQVVPNLQASCMRKRKESQQLLCARFHVATTSPTL